MNFLLFGLIVVAAGVLFGATEFGPSDRIGAGEGGAFAAPVDAGPVARSFVLIQVFFDFANGCAVGLYPKKFPGVGGPEVPVALPVVMPGIAAGFRFQCVFNPFAAGVYGTFPGGLEGGLGEVAIEVAFDDDEVGHSLGDFGQGGGNDLEVLAIGGLADGPGEVGEEIGAAIEVAEFAGVLDEALDGGEGDGGVGGCHRGGVTQTGARHNCRADFTAVAIYSVKILDFLCHEIFWGHWLEFPGSGR